MIFDTIRNRNLYGALSPRIKAALDYLASQDFSIMEVGRYEIDGDNVFALVQKYNTVPKESGKWECHKKYIDVQFIAEGTEMIGFNHIDQMEIKNDYNPEKDITILHGEGDYVTVRKGFYGIFYPQDVHQPKVAYNNLPDAVTKVVVKVKV